MTKQAHTIEFIHGPFDGHVEVVKVAAEKLPKNMMCYVSENVFRLFEGRERKQKTTITSVAIYELHPSRVLSSYVFVKAVGIDQISLTPLSKAIETGDSDA